MLNKQVVCVLSITSQVDSPVHCVFLNHLDNLWEVSILLLWFYGVICVHKRMRFVSSKYAKVFGKLASGYKVYLGVCWHLCILNTLFYVFFKCEDVKRSL